jgi:hypothetical protein
VREEPLWSIAIALSGASASVSDTTIFTTEFDLPSYNNLPSPRPKHLITAQLDNCHFFDFYSTDD